jgi:hypothetical protein
MTSKYAVVSGAIFGVVAVAHAVRALYEWPVQIGSLDISVWVSWVAMVVTGSLCAWAIRSGHK